MKAELLMDERHALSEDSFAEIVIWKAPVIGSGHGFKYRLAFVVKGECVLRYDNEAGKGDHCHIGAVEEPYRFVSPEQLLEDFWTAVDEWRRT